MKTNINSLEMYLRDCNYAYTPHERYLELLHQNSGEIIYIIDIHNGYEIQYKNKTSFLIDETDVVMTLNNLMSQRKI